MKYLIAILLINVFFLFDYSKQSNLFAQGFEYDEFSEEDDVENAVEEGTKKVEKKEEYEENDNDEFDEEDSIEGNVDSQEKEEQKKENARLAAEKVLEEANAKKRKENAVRLKIENEKNKALAEKRMREARKKAEAKKLKDEKERIAARKASMAYSHYFTAFMSRNNIRNKMPSPTGWAFGINIGFSPNAGNATNEGFTFSDRLTFYGNSAKALPIHLPYVTSGNKMNKGVANVANLFQNQVNNLNAANPDGKKAVVDSSSGILNTFPIGVNLAYYADFFLLRLGVNYSNSFLGLGGTNQFSFYFVEQKVFIKHSASISRLEVPLSFAFRFLNSRAYGMYMGGGLNFFWGQNISEITSNDNITFSNGVSGKFISEKDKFTAMALGFHILLGIEAEIYDDMYLSVELFQNIGYSNRVKDSAIGERNGSSSGSLEIERPDEIQLNFSGTEILIGVRKFI